MKAPRLALSVTAPSAYERSWNVLRRRERLCWFVALTFVPGAALLILSTAMLSTDVPDHFGLWVAGTWLSAFLAAGLYRLRFRCPRCEQLFFSAAGERRRSDQSCAHCGQTR